MKGDFVFNSESVTEGHPDKLCDQIGDAIVDRFLERDPHARIIAESAVAKGVVFVAARFASTARVDIAEVARGVVRQVGYERGEFNAEDCTVLTSFLELGSDVYVQRDERELDDEALERLAPRIQATAFGFACNQTAALMPLPIWLAHRLARRLSAARLERRLPYLAPDGKAQVAVEYRDGRPARIHSITLIASQAESGRPDPGRLHDDLLGEVVDPVFLNEPVRPDPETRLFVNPYGPVVVGGPAVHAGLTGRKTAADTYGEYARHSGAALSGKGPLRVDRVAPYAARWAAKNVVAAGLAEDCEVQLTYTIGLSQPVSLRVETFGTGREPAEALARRLQAVFDFRLGAIIRQFSLRELPARTRGGFYRRLAAYGQVGRMDIGLPWEATDRAQELRG
jgi:S-adenosylmethionine synthetase